MCQGYDNPHANTIQQTIHKTGAVCTGIRMIWQWEGGREKIMLESNWHGQYGKWVNKYVYCVSVGEYIKIWICLLGGGSATGAGGGDETVPVVLTYAHPFNSGGEALRMLEKDEGTLYTCHVVHWALWPHCEQHHHQYSISICLSNQSKYLATLLV